MSSLRDIGKLYYQNNEDGELYELGPAVDVSIHSETNCIVTGTVEFRVTSDTFKKTKDFVKETPVFTITDKGLTFYSKDGTEIGGFTADSSHPKDCIDISPLYPDIMITDIEAEKMFNEYLQKKIKNKKEELKMVNIELIKIYRENAEKVITEAIEKETETRMEMDSFISTYNTLIADFEKDLTKLYEKQPLTGRRLDQSCSSNLYGIRISPFYKDEVATDVAKVYEKYIIELDARLTEVEAQLDIIRKANPTNSYELTMNVLRNYGIVDENNMLNKYELPVEKEVVEEAKDEVKTTTPKKRGRKPKNK